MFVCVALFSVLSEQEKFHLANNEKIIGNEAFIAKDYEEAVAYYSRWVLETLTLRELIDKSISLYLRTLLPFQVNVFLKTDLKLRIGEYTLFVQQRASLHYEFLLILLTQCWSWHQLSAFWWNPCEDEWMVNSGLLLQEHFHYSDCSHVQQQSPGGDQASALAQSSAGLPECSPAGSRKYKRWLKIEQITPTWR